MPDLNLERTKLEIDVLKHITTLSTGSIVLVIGLRITDHASAWYVRAALLFLCASIIACCIGLEALSGDPERQRVRAWQYRLGKLICVWCFIFGTIILGGILPNVSK